MANSVQQNQSAIISNAPQRFDVRLLNEPSACIYQLDECLAQLSTYRNAFSMDHDQPAL
jgi:hypothetical protein